MTEPTTAVAKSASKAAADVANKVLPQVIDTAELALEVPSKVILKQPIIVIAAVVAGTALGAGALYAVNKIRNRGKVLMDLDEVTNPNS